MAILTQGTELYFLDPGDSSGEVVTQLVCPTAITGLNSPRDQIETTCLDSVEAEYLPGLSRPGAATITIQFDPTEPSHRRLLELKEDPTVQNIWWAIGFSDGIGIPPTSGDSSGFVVPTTRTFLMFEAYLTDVPFDFSLNAVVTSTIGLQVSGGKTISYKTT
jgi:Phage tail tube, TTP, lambda-like